MKTVQLIEKTTNLTKNVNVEQIVAFYNDGKDTLAETSDGHLYKFEGSEEQLARAL